MTHKKEDKSYLKMMINFRDLLRVKDKWQILLNNKKKKRALFN